MSFLYKTLKGHISAVDNNISSKRQLTHSSDGMGDMYNYFQLEQICFFSFSPSFHIREFIQY